MSQTKQDYKFINGNGDASHTAELSAAGANGWKVVQLEFDPDAKDAKEPNKRLVVLLEKPL